MKKYLALLILCLPMLGLAQNHNVTFKVNTANITVGPNGLFAGGGVIGGSNALQLTDPDSNGVYEGTTSLNGSAGGNFIFFNSPTGAADWGLKRTLLDYHVQIRQIMMIEYFQHSDKTLHFYSASALAQRIQFVQYCQLLRIILSKLI